MTNEITTPEVEALEATTVETTTETLEAAVETPEVTAETPEAAV